MISLHEPDGKVLKEAILNSPDFCLHYDFLAVYGYWKLGLNPKAWTNAKEPYIKPPEHP